MSRPLSIALLQLRAFELSDHEQAWTELLRRIDDAAGESPRLIVAPEAAYPASVLGAGEAAGGVALRSDAEVLAMLGDRARRHACYLAVGLVLRDPFGVPQNAAVLIAPGGAVIARATEAHPAGGSARGGGPVSALVDDTRVALLVGRDAGDADAVGALVEGGARLLLSIGAGAAWGPALDRLPEPRAHLLLAARAVESGVWAATAAKVGLEAGSLVHGGRAGIVSPHGAWVVRAPSDRPGIVLHTIDPALATGPRVARPQGVARTVPPEDEHAPVVAVLALAPTPSAVALVEGLRALVRAAASQGAQLLVLPDLAGIETRAVTSAESLPLIEALSRETRTILIVALAERGDGETYKTAYVIDRGTTIVAHRQSALSAAERAAGFAAGTTPPPVVDTAAGRIGLLCGMEGLVPSLAADLVVHGATLIAWCAGDPDVPVEPLARARAIETGRPVLAAGIPVATGGGSIIDAGGAVLAITLEGQSMAALSELRREA